MKSFRQVCFVSAVLAVAMVFPGCGKKPETKGGISASRLVGTWINMHHPKLPELVINENGTYFLKFLRDGMQFNGNYQISEDLIHFVDFYCGTAVPGIYRVKMAGDSLVFDPVDDSKCDRARFFSKTWRKAK
jgi:hypothetical protein